MLNTLHRSLPPLCTHGVHFPSFYTPVPGSCFKAFHSLPPSESKTKNSKEITESIRSIESIWFPPVSSPECYSNYLCSFWKREKRKWSRAGLHLPRSIWQCSNANCMDNVQFKWWFLTYCSAVTLSFASSDSFASSYRFWVWFCFLDFFSVSLTTQFLSSSQYSQRSKEGICGQGRGSFVWKKQRDKKSNKDSEKQDFPDLSFQILLSFFRNQESGLYRLYNIWSLCYLTTFWINLGWGGLQGEICSKCTWILKNLILLNYFLKAAVWAVPPHQCSPSTARITGWPKHRERTLLEKLQGRCGWCCRGWEATPATISVGTAWRAWWPSLTVLHLIYSWTHRNPVASLGY